MSQWHEFVMLFEQEGVNRCELGRRFGVCPTIGYRLWACWRTAGKGGWRTGRAARSIRPGAARRRWKAWCWRAARRIARFGFVAGKSCKREFA
jgi:hypothetical protein